MTGKRVDIQKLYSKELNDIKYILDNLEKGNIYERTGATMHGYLATNVIELRKKLNFLLNEIQYGKTTSLDEMDDLFN
ncbi:hypothetical protein [Ornithinibacillus sp. JPR2-1]|uniref:hypothetical protein n=1 Tax=Ornithinibacillus sp. JPR2-1 TaxID=2094019 RepID=UPI0031D6A54F